MKTIGTYAFEITTRRGFEDAITRVTELLAAEGFGVLTQIDVRATLKEKLHLEYRPYRILGACNPPFLHKALAAEPHVGVLVPCNVVVREEPDGRIWVGFMDPEAVLKLVDKPEVHSLGKDVRLRLERVRNSLT